MGSKAEVLTTDTPEAFESAIRRAVELLRKGEVVALPTETVYGLAANALDARAVSRIFELKGRPSHNPVIVHVSNLEMAEQCVAAWPVLAKELARAFWPGPLTLVLPRSHAIPDVVTSGGETVGLRWPSHPFIQAVIQKCRFPLAAPSANRANSLSPTNAEHVRKYFGENIPLIVDGGQCQVGIESTVVDLSVTLPRLLRPGMIHEEALLAVTEKLEVTGGKDGPILKSPGQLRRHYSPRARLILCEWKNEADLRRQLAGQSSQLKTHIVAHTRIPSGESFAGVSVIPHDPEAFARAIYAELHQCDEAGAELIVVEEIPNTSEWRAIGDRLKRAATQP
jgi:L-threonylcarbamoyladenylate synthase